MEDRYRFDQKSLDAIGKEARQTGNQLLETVGLSPTACPHYPQRLSKTGAIKRGLAVVDPAYKRKGT